MHRVDILPLHIYLIKNTKEMSESSQELKCLCLIVFGIQLPFLQIIKLESNQHWSFFFINRNCVQILLLDFSYLK